MRIAILWTHPSGYLNACLRELASRPGVELFLCRMPAPTVAPFDEELFSWMRDQVVWHDDRDFQLVQSKLHTFNPDVVIVAGWHVPLYRRIIKPLKGSCVRIMTMDNCWNGTLKQWLGVLISPVYVRCMAEAIWVPGQRQATFARRLGFPASRILQGLYSCDYPVFEAVYKQRLQTGSALPKAFIFVGRLIEVKGIRTLLEAYTRYRAAVETPWPLIVCGTGPLRSLLEGKSGVELFGFVQPAELPRIMSLARCLVLPSEFEPWALVVNEATAAGLMVIATENVGAVPHLVRNYYNGFTVGVGDPDELAKTMIKVNSMEDARTETMSRKSHELSQQYTPENWASTLLTLANDLRVGQRS